MEFFHDLDKNMTKDVDLGDNKHVLRWTYKPMSKNDYKHVENIFVKSKKNKLRTGEARDFLLRKLHVDISVYDVDNEDKIISETKQPYRIRTGGKIYVIDRGNLNLIPPQIQDILFSDAYNKYKGYDSDNSDEVSEIDNLEKNSLMDSTQETETISA